MADSKPVKIGLLSHCGRALFAKRCAANNWLEAARLPDVVGDLVKAGDVPRPAKLFLAGFEELTPQQSDFFAALGECAELEPQRHESEPERWMLRDSAAEIRAAAAWARRILEQSPAAQIGIIVPGLTSLRAKVERIFRETLDPGSEFDDRERSFHVSLGPALDRYPVVSAALLMLEFAGASLALAEGRHVAALAFSGRRRNRVDQARADRREIAKGRRVGCVARTAARSRWKLSTACARGREIPEARAPTPAGTNRQRMEPRFFRSARRTRNGRATARSSSREYQVVEKWHGLLSSLATLDAALPPISFDQAVSRLRELAAASTFQVENEGAPVQIMGLLEASGLQFDRLWVMGLHDEALPEPANPNPFLPISLQRDYKLPHSSAERELEFAMKLMDRLLTSARHVVLSYPATEGDRSLGPSALVAGGAWPVAGEGESPSEWVVKMRGAVKMEELRDDHAPPVVAETMQPGGATLFKDMAACPFRAFAKHRLGARPLERADLGVNKRDQGNAAHKALALIWNELGNHTRLMELAPDSLRELISRSVAAAIEQLGSGIGRSLERRRLEKILAEWLELEKLRNWFTVQATEQDHLVSLGGLQIRTRADRVDQIANGGEIILDYKTGMLKTGGWDGARPDEPQLPLYCSTAGAEPIAGAAFARIRTGEIAFRGLTENGVSLPGFTPMRFETERSFTEQLAEWKRVLERLAQDYGAGVAVVDPKRDACDLCGLRALCRIRELEHDRG